MKRRQIERWLTEQGYWFHEQTRRHVIWTNGVQRVTLQSGTNSKWYHFFSVRQKVQNGRGRPCNTRETPS